MVQSPLAFRFTDLKCVADGILMYQLVQETEDSFVFRYIPCKGSLSGQSKKEIEGRILTACNGESVRVGFEETDDIRRNRRGKLDRLVSKVSRRRPRQSFEVSP